VSAGGTAPLSYQWQRNGTNIPGATGASYTTPATTVPDSGSSYRVIVSNVAGSVTSNAAVLTVISAGGSLPAPWLDQDIGSVGVAGNAGFSSGSFTVQGGGADIWGTMDAFHFVYQQLSGDGSIVARVTGLGNTNAWAKAGVMIRETLNADSKFADVVVTPANGTSFQRRTTTGGSASSTTGPAAAAPYWVKIERVGNVFTGSVSSDGATWTVIGTETIPMAATVYIGIAVTSHDATVTTTASADSVSGSGGWAGGGGGGGGAGGSGGGTAGGNHRGGGCGATGLEALVVLALAALSRRRRVS
jgi:uncharacterized protein (TIGR03382 family)